MSNTKNCASTALYESLEHCKGTTVLPGLRPHVFYIPKRDIVTFPAPPNTVPDGGHMGALATISKDFILAADAKWKKIDIVSNASNVNSESQGDAPSKTFKNSGVFKYPGNNAAAAAFCRQANADDIVYLWPQRDGQYRLLGNNMFETNTTPSQESGSAETDASGTTINVAVTDVMPSPFYTGKIETVDGDISGADGSPVTAGGSPVPAGG